MLSQNSKDDFWFRNFFQIRFPTRWRVTRVHKIGAEWTKSWSSVKCKRNKIVF